MFEPDEDDDVKEEPDKDLAADSVGFVIMELRYKSFPIIGVIERQRYEGQPSWFGSTKPSDLQMLSALGLL